MYSIFSTFLVDSRQKQEISFYFRFLNFFHEILALPKSQVYYLSMYKQEKYSAPIWTLQLKLKISMYIVQLLKMIFFVQKVAEFKAKRNDKKSSSKKRELSTTAAPLPPKNGFKKFDFHDKFGFEWWTSAYSKLYLRSWGCPAKMGL